MVTSQLVFLTESFWKQNSWTENPSKRQTGKKTHANTSSQMSTHNRCCTKYRNFLHPEYYIHLSLHSFDHTLQNIATSETLRNCFSHKNVTNYIKHCLREKTLFERTCVSTFSVFCYFMSVCEQTDWVLSAKTIQHRRRIRHVNCCFHAENSWRRSTLTFCVEKLLQRRKHFTLWNSLTTERLT